MFRNRSTPRRSAAPFAAWIVTAFIFSCSSGPATSDPDMGGSNPTDAGPHAGLDPVSFLWLQITTSSPEGRTSYLQVLDPDILDSPTVTAVDTSNAVELAGNARVFVDGQRIYTGGGESPIIQRWHLDRNGDLTPGERVSFANLGLGFTPFGNNFVSPTRAYLFDGPGLRVIVWNPTTLEFVDTIDISAVSIPGFAPDINPGVIRDDGLLFVLVAQQDFAGGFNRGIQALIIDTNTDQVVDVIEDDRCVGGFGGFDLFDDGTLYVAGDNYLLRHYFDPTLPPACLLRINPGEMDFDETYFFDVQAVTGFHSNGARYRADNRFLTIIVDESLAEPGVTPQTAPLTFLNMPVGRWWEVDLDTPSNSHEITSLGAVTPRSGGGQRIDGRFYMFRALEAFGPNTLVELTDDDQVREVFNLTGRIAGIGIIEDIQ